MAAFSNGKSSIKLAVGGRRWIDIDLGETRQKKGGLQMKPLGRKFYMRDAVPVAEALLGCILTRELPNGKLLSGMIVETEAYRQDDPACHAFGNWQRLQKGQAIGGRSELLFGEPGIAYVYRNYGIHWLFNVVCDQPGVGAAVLVRAVQPLEGLDLMLKNRRMSLAGPNLTNGPGKLTQALAIDGSFNGLNLIGKQKYGVIITKARLRPSQVITTTRIGITKGTDLPWRFYLKNNPYVSRPILHS